MGLPSTQSLGTIHLSAGLFAWNRMHRSAVIYRLYYSCYLQAIQVHLGYKWVSGQPAKKEIQTHEELLRTNQSAVKRFCFTRFIQWADENSFQRVANETNVQWIKRVNELYTTCKQWKNHPDEPTKMITLKIKAMESYLRCVHSVKESNFWLLEK